MKPGQRVTRDRVVLALAAAILLAPVAATAGGERAGSAAANFLTVGTGVGVLGMGGAGLGLDGGLATATWNVASLASVRRSEIVFTHAALADQTAQEWGGVAGRLPFAGLKGAVTGLFQSEGTFEGRDAFNNPIGNFEVSSVALGLGVARAFGRFVTAGLGFKYASENLGSVRGSGMTFDAGLQARAGAFGFGAAAQNAFGQMRYDGAIYDFPTSYGIGASYDHAATGLRVALDMNFPAAYYTDVRGGIEWRWNDRFALRTGYRAEMGAGPDEPLGGPTFGMGAGARGMWLDYGYLAGGAGQHRIGITFQPGAMALLEPDHGSSGYSSGAGSMPGAHETGGEKRATVPRNPNASVAPNPPASAGASVAPTTTSPKPTTPSVPTKPAQTNAPNTGKEAAATVPTTTSSKPAPATVPAPASAPATQVAVRDAAKPAPPPASVPAPTSAAKPSSPNAPAPTSAVAGSGTGASAGAAVAGQVPGAATPAATPLANSYTQRAKAARGTSNASSSGRASAASSAGTYTASPRAPVAPAEAAPAKKDSTTSAKAGATSPATPASPQQTSASSPAGAVAAQGTGAPASSAPPPAPARPRPEKVKVKGKQTMADIAAMYGTSAAAIMMENNLTSDRVRPGQTLKLPKK